MLEIKSTPKNPALLSLLIFTVLVLSISPTKSASAHLNLSHLSNSGSGSGSGSGFGSDSGSPLSTQIGKVTNISHTSNIVQSSDGKDDPKNDPQDKPNNNNPEPIFLIPNLPHDGDHETEDTEDDHDHNHDEEDQLSDTNSTVLVGKPPNPGSSGLPIRPPEDLLPLPEPEPETDPEERIVPTASIAYNETSHFQSFEGVGSNYNPYANQNQDQNQNQNRKNNLVPEFQVDATPAPPISKKRTENDGSKNTKLLHYVMNLNLTGNPGKRPLCDCGMRRIGGVVSGKEDEYWFQIQRAQEGGSSTGSSAGSGSGSNAGKKGRSLFPSFLDSLLPNIKKNNDKNTTTISLSPLSSNTSLSLGLNLNSPSNGNSVENPKQNQSQSHKIVGGTAALINEFPWVVGLQTSIANNATMRCGGSIIDKSWVLTAAHCFKELNVTTVIYVNAGEHDKTTPTETDNVIIRASMVVVHPRYDKNTNDNDIALVRLERDLTFRYNIQPICLPYKLVERDLTGATVIANGWGDTRENGTESRFLQTTDLTLLTTIQCRNVLGIARANTITNNMLCTLAPGRDTCQGDSGGTIDYFDADTGRYMAVGITSFGEGCARPGEPGVYTKVANYLDFIRLTTSAAFCLR